MQITGPTLSNSDLSTIWQGSEFVFEKKHLIQVEGSTMGKYQDGVKHMNQRKLGE